MDDLIHDAHSTHYDDVVAQSKPCFSHYERALRLANEAIVYSSRVLVSAPNGIIGYSSPIVEGGV